MKSKTQSPSLKQIIEDIQRWEDNKKDTKLIASLLRIVRGIRFPLGGKLVRGEDLHIYPAIHLFDKQPEMRFYLISSSNDTPDNASADIIELAEIMPEDSIVSNVPISSLLAQSRIEAWTKNFDSWLESSSALSLLFEALVVPAGDLDADGMTGAYLALRINTSEVKGPDFWMDLIVDAPFAKLKPYVVQYDTVMPVPPFGSKATERKKFYLLGQLSKK